MKRLILACGALVAALVACSVVGEGGGTGILNDHEAPNQIGNGEGMAPAACRIADAFDAGTITPVGPDGCGAGTMLVYETTLPNGSGASGIDPASTASGSGDEAVVSSSF